MFILIFRLRRLLILPLAISLGFIAGAVCFCSLFWVATTGMVTPQFQQLVFYGGILLLIALPIILIARFKSHNSMMGFGVAFTSSPLLLIAAQTLIISIWAFLYGMGLVDNAPL